MTQLDARFPIALLPVRLETRLAGTQLKIRIYPDEIFADTHEPGLTSAEVADGAAYVASIGTAGEPQRWAALVAAYTAPRAAWIARASAAGSSMTRAESWTRAAHAVLPDSWLVRVVRGGETFTRTVESVRSPLALTVSPVPGAQVPVSDALTVDAELKWTLDFAEATAAGMAIAIDLTTPDAGSGAATPEAGIDVFVVGVNHDGEDAGAARLRALLDAHHYTRGFGFVAAGTPTSNSGDATAPEDPNGAHAFALERGAPLVAPDDHSNGERFATLLGLPTLPGERVAAVEHVDGAARQDEAAAAAMSASLWPVTLGYFLEQMMTPSFDAATIAAARAYFLANVRPGGPLPAFRVGRVPYGLLPAMSLTRYAPDSRLSYALRMFRGDARVDSVPRVTLDSVDPDGDLLKALAVDASSHTIRMRALVGPEVISHASGLLGNAEATMAALERAARAAAAAVVLQSFGLGGNTRIGTLDSTATPTRIGAPLVSRTLSETEGVAYIHTLIAWAGGVPGTPMDLASIRDDKLPGTERPMLYRLLRHALLLEMDRIRTDLGAVDIEPELVGFATARTVGTSTARTVTNAYKRIEAAVLVPAYAQRLRPYIAHLQAIASLPSAELHRRFGETLDVCSHRVDAWITSLATERLYALRKSAASGCHTGAFGWVEGVRAAPATPTVGGFIHAPSAAHASAAAILRNGYLSRGGGSSPYAVNLDSARVRSALALLDGARGGEPLSALLGLQFERELHDRKLEKLISQLRTQFPLVAGRTPESDGPVELVAATNVIDGLALRAARPQPAGLSQAETREFTAALATLDEAIDGVADVLTAESIFQTVRGNPHAAVSSLDAMAQAVNPPEPAVVRTPGGGLPYVQRLVVALDGTLAAPAGATPRAAAEPSLDAWLGHVLGDLSKVGCRVIAADGAEHEVTLAQLGLRPIDIVQLAKSSTERDGELERRVLDAADAAAGARVDYTIAHASHTFAEWVELARAAATLVGGARPLVPIDLSSPVDATGTEITHETAADATARAQTAVTALRAAQAALASGTPATRRAALRAAASFGIVGAYPAPGATDEELASVATAVHGEIATRLARVPALTATEPAAQLAAAQAAATTVFGADFLLLPRAVPPPAMGTALAESPALLRDPHRPRQVLQQVARVRAGAGRWRALFLYAEALGTLAPSVDVAQLPPHQPAWAADPGAAPANGTVSLALHRAASLATDRAWAGLVIDEWTELIPAATQATAISFRHETPVAEAPQAVLLAVPPTAAAAWDLDTVLDTVRETLLLAKIRLVEPSEHQGPFLPAITLTGNTANETVSTDFLGSLVAEPTLRSL
jgi:hypothetical protein